MLDDRLSLQSLEVVLLVCGVLVYDEEVAGQFGDDEAKIELQERERERERERGREGESKASWKMLLM